MKRAIRHPVTLSMLGLVLLLGLFSIYDRHARIEQGEEIQRQLLGRVIATRESLVSMHPDLIPFGEGSLHWLYRLAPGQFDRERRHCIDEVEAVDPRTNRGGVPVDDTRQCWLADRADDGTRAHFQIILGDATLAVSVINP
jgi:hypothetical protein